MEAKGLWSAFTRQTPWWKLTLLRKKEKKDDEQKPEAKRAPQDVLAELDTLPTLLSTRQDNLYLDSENFSSKNQEGELTTKPSTKEEAAEPASNDDASPELTNKPIRGVEVAKSRGMGVLWCSMSMRIDRK
jgi:hypothetical protein